MEAIVEYFLQHHDKLLYVLAGVSLVIELTIMGLSGPLLFFAIACVLTGLFVSAGLITSWEFEVLSVGILAILSTMLLWKPLKKFQGEAPVSDNSSDMIGQVVPIQELVTLNGGSIRYSGINWQARLHNSATVASLESGLRVIIIAIDGNVMLVKEQVPTDD